MRKLIPLLICLSLMTTLGSASREAQIELKSYLVITHANLIDGVSAAPISDAIVIVHDGRIENVIIGKAELPAGATVLDLKGRWLLPGFVDAHVHLADMSAARRALASGATTVRCLGVNHFVDIGFRELNHGGVADIPDVVAAGYHVRPRPAEQLFLDMPKMKDLMNGVNGTESVRRMVRAMIDRGVDVMEADLIAIERDPIADITAIQDVIIVVNNGKIAVNRLGW
jgi:imidazolonepropionase-like amidohydrolase